MNNSHAPAVAGAKGETTVIATAVHTVERWRARGDRGRLAELRRLQRGGTPSEAFWALADAADANGETEQFLRQYLPVVASTKHRAGVRPGRSFQLAGISPARFDRWLRQPQLAAIDESRQLVRRCASIDLIRLGIVLRFWRDEDRVQLAREFYRKNGSSSTSNATPSLSVEPFNG